MVYCLITVNSGRLDKVEWFENDKKAKEVYSKIKEQTNENSNVKLEEINGLNKGDKVEIYIKGGWVRNVTPLENSSEAETRADEDVVVVEYRQTK
jgi:hypothetical protein